MCYFTESYLSMLRVMILIKGYFFPNFNLITECFEKISNKLLFQEKFSPLFGIRDIKYHKLEGIVRLDFV